MKLYRVSFKIGTVWCTNLCKAPDEDAVREHHKKHDEVLVTLVPDEIAETELRIAERKGMPVTIVE